MATRSRMKVHLYIYDISLGMAAQLSPMFLGNACKIWFLRECGIQFPYIGKRIEGIW